MEAIILAAGIGKRLTNKYSLKINGKTLIEHQYEKLRRFTKDIYVVYYDENIKHNHQHLNVKWIKNNTGEKSDSIKYAINNCSNTCLVVLADMINIEYDRYFALSKTTFSYNQNKMPPVVINKQDFSTIINNNFTSIKELIIGETLSIDDYEKTDIDYIEDVIKSRKTVVVVSGGDLASATINRLSKFGYNVIVVEKQNPLAVRRTVSYSEAMYDGEKTIDGIKVKRSCVDNIYQDLETTIPIISDKEFQTCNIEYDLIIDITLRKKRIKYNRLSIGVGPGFISGEDVTYVIESMRGKNLGKVIKNGSALENTGVPAIICGFDKERVLYSPCEGIFKSSLNIGDSIKKGSIFGYVENIPVYAKIDGIIRGQIRNNAYVKNNVKIGDINPIDNNVDINKFSDKSLVIAKNILELVEEIL